MVITINGLSAESLQKAARKVRRYQNKVAYNNKELVKALAYAGILTASRHLDTEGDSAPPSFTTIDPHVSTGKGDGSLYATLRLKGEDVAFVEFGAGVHFNGEVGTSPNEYGVELGYTIGSYGHGHGAQDYWYYKDKSGNEHKSYGTKASMPLFYASNAIKNSASALAQDAFRS